MTEKDKDDLTLGEMFKDFGIILPSSLFTDTKYEEPIYPKFNTKKYLDIYLRVREYKHKFMDFHLGDCNVHGKYDLNFYDVIRSCEVPEFVPVLIFIQDIYIKRLHVADRIRLSSIDMMKSHNRSVSEGWAVNDECFNKRYGTSPEWVASTINQYDNLGEHNLLHFFRDILDIKGLNEVDELAVVLSRMHIILYRLKEDVMIMLDRFEHLIENMYLKENNLGTGIKSVMKKSREEKEDAYRYKKTTEEIQREK